MSVRERVLVIEDNPQDRELVEAFLDPTRYEVQTAEGGGLGLSAASAHPPDIILLDLRLPDLDGYEVCRQLRKWPETQRIPIVIITASDDLTLNRHAYAAGAQACLPKPFRKEALVAVMEAVLAGSGGRRSRSRRGKDASPSGEPKEHAMMWETLGPYRDFLISVKQLGPTGWAAAVTPLPQPAEGRASATASPNELVFPEGFDSQAAAEAAAKRYVDREHDRQVQREAPEGGEGLAVPGKHLRQRRFLRFPVYLPVIGFAPQVEQGEILGVVRTASAGGLMVEFPVELAPGSAVDLAILTQRGPLEVEAQTVWTAASEDTVRHGLAFAQPKDLDFAVGLSVVGTG
jgi:CheY-like chemotaxis protein